MYTHQQYQVNHLVLYQKQYPYILVHTDITQDGGDTFLMMQHLNGVQFSMVTKVRNEVILPMAITDTLLE